MLRKDADHSVQLIAKQFLCCVPVRKISWENFFTHATWDRQATLIANTVDLDIVLRFPIKISYQIAFLKRFIDELSRLNADDLNDCVYNAFGRLVALSDQQKYYYKHYAYDFANKIITLEENSSIISEGTTGLCSWQAALALSEWCLRNRDILSDKTILELGSGVGLTGLVVSLNCNPKKYYFTDCHPVVLKTLRKNVLLNLSNACEINEISQELANVCKLNSRIGIIDLKWEEVELQSEKFRNIDVILAADVVYDSSVFPALCRALKYFLRNNRAEIYLACTERNSETLSEFQNSLEHFGLESAALDLPKQQNFCWDITVPIRLLKIRARIGKQGYGIGFVLVSKTYLPVNLQNEMV